MTITTNIMKTMLYNKLCDENCNFKKSDISIRKENKNYKIVIKDYEHIVFIIKLENDDFGKIITLWKQYKGKTHKNLLNLEEEHTNESMTSTLIQLGYYIGTRF